MTSLQIRAFFYIVLADMKSFASQTLLRGQYWPLSTSFHVFNALSLEWILYQISETSQTTEMSYRFTITWNKQVCISFTKHAIIQISLYKHLRIESASIQCMTHSRIKALMYDCYTSNTSKRMTVIVHASFKCKFHFPFKAWHNMPKYLHVPSSSSSVLMQTTLASSE